MDKLNILMADNQSFTRTGIKAILSGYFNHHLLIEEVSDKEEMFEKLQTNSYDVVIIDFTLFNFDNIKQIKEIRQITPCIGILVITNNQNPEDILEVLDCGITNYITKSCSTKELIEAFDATVNNRKYLSSQILEVLLDRKAIGRHVPVQQGYLTPSEMDIVRLITQGLTTKEIAIRKKLSYHTIITHRKNIFRKLGISNASELVMYAMRTGIIDTTEYYI